MKIRKISCYKVVVELTNNDLDKLELNPEKEPRANIHKFLFNVMKKVQNQTGFDPYHGGQVIVEATPSEEGMDLVISKIPGSSHKMSREDFKRIKSIKVKDTIKLKRDEVKRVFVFDTYEDLENLMANMCHKAFLNMTLYRHNGRYALISCGNISDDTKRIMCEYAIKWGRYNPTHCHILESWEKVAQRSELCEMAEKLKAIL